MTEKTETPLDPQTTARVLMIAASRFAAASMEEFVASFPGQAELLAQAGGNYFVKVNEILSTTPRVSLVNVIGGNEIEIASVLLRCPGPAAADLRKMN